MNQAEIIRMARGAGCNDEFVKLAPDWLERFAKLVAAAEREECAKVCEELRDDWLPAADFCAEAIRARGKA